MTDSASRAALSEDLRRYVIADAITRLPPAQEWYETRHVDHADMDLPSFGRVRFLIRKGADGSYRWTSDV